MTITAFIRDNRQAIDSRIRQLNPDTRFSHSERRMWILNDEDLYLWARSEGVKI